MDAEFGSCESFLVDDGQLEGMTPQQCFVLGYELHSVVSVAERHDSEINKTVHAANIERIEAFLRARAREWTWVWPSDDVSESWVHLKILARCSGSRATDDGDLPLYETWLEENGFERHGTYMGRLVDAPSGSIVEVTLTPTEHADGLGWSLSLLQDNDHVTITSVVYRDRGQLRQFFDAIGAKI